MLAACDIYVQRQCAKVEERYVQETRCWTRWKAELLLGKLFIYSCADLLVCTCMWCWVYTKRASQASLMVHGRRPQILQVSRNASVRAIISSPPLATLGESLALCFLFLWKSSQLDSP